MATRKARRVIAKAKTQKKKAVSKFVKSRTDENVKLTGRKNISGNIRGSLNTPLGKAGLAVSLGPLSRKSAALKAQKKIVKKVKSNQTQIRQAQKSGPKKKRRK